MKWLLALTVGLLLSAPVGVASAAPVEECRRQCGVGAERNGNSDVSVHGTLTTPATAVTRDLSGRHRVARETPSRGRTRSDCPGCTYTTVPLVGPDGPGGRFGVPFRGCARDQFAQTRLVYRTAPGQARPDLVGMVCPQEPAAPGATDPVITLEMVEAEVRRQVERFAPPAPEVGVAPAATAPVNLPVLVWASPQGTIRRDVAPFGIPVTVTLAPSWEWNFEPGATARTGHPGQPYRPDGGPVAGNPSYVTHAYRTPGSRDVAVTVRWTATWSLDGGPARPLGDLTRTATAGVTVREAPARLVAR